MLKPFKSWLNAELRNMPEWNAAAGPGAMRVIADSSGLAYTTIDRLTRDSGSKVKLTTADRVAAAFDVLLSDAVDTLETDKQTKALYSASARPLPILQYGILRDTTSPDCMRSLFSWWLRSAIASYQISARQLSHAVGKSEAYISSIVNAKMMCPTLQSAEDICNKLQFRLGDVLRDLESVQDLVYDLDGDMQKCRKALYRRAAEQKPKLDEFNKGRGS